MLDMKNPSSLLILLALISLVPFVAIMVTSFVKLAIVFSLLRNALGVQQIPPNMALYGLSIILTLYIMSPVGYEIGDILEQKQYSLTDLSDVNQLKNVLQDVSQPMISFLKKFSSLKERSFFMDTAHILWPEERLEKITEDNLLILIPAFTVSELTAAFEIGFLLYLPFLIIDLIISNILLALGMMMVSPMTISLPFKLLLFVLVDGWARLVHGLVLTYQ